MLTTAVLPCWPPPVLQLLIFLRAHQLLSEHNHQCVMALTPNSSPVLVTPDSCSGNSAALPALLLERVTRLMESQASTQQQDAGALDSFGSTAHSCWRFDNQTR